MFVDITIAALSLPVLGWTAYLAALAILSRANRAPRYESPARQRFDIVVPAHDEEAGIADTVQSLLAIDYPRELYRVVVVADNCHDATAERAAEAGAIVIERDDSARRGKGYALEHAFSRIVTEGKVDAVVGDRRGHRVTPNLLRAFAARLGVGARAAQAEYGVVNRAASSPHRLMRIAFALLLVRPLSRTRAAPASPQGYRGNGMILPVSLLREVHAEASNASRTSNTVSGRPDAASACSTSAKRELLWEMVTRGDASAVSGDVGREAGGCSPGATGFVWSARPCGEEAPS